MLDIVFCIAPIFCAEIAFAYAGIVLLAADAAAIYDARNKADDKIILFMVSFAVSCMNYIMKKVVFII